MNSPTKFALLHGWATEPTIWQFVQDQLQAHGFDVQIYEMPGYGSRRAESGVLTLELLVEDSIEAIEANTIWVGWSLGAMIALSAAQKQDSIRGVVGVCATAKFCFDSNKQVELSQLQESVTRENAKAVIRFQLSMPSTANRRSVSKLVRSSEAVASTETLLAGLETLQRADLTDKVSRIEVPVSLISGSEDTIIPASSGEELSRLIPNSSYTALPCGHIPFLECPELFLEQLVEFAQTIANSESGSKPV